MMDTSTTSTPPNLEPTRRDRASRSGSNPRSSRHKLAGALAALSTAAAVHGQTILYVDDDAPGGGNGRSWNEAFNDLQDALWLASFIWEDTEIRIAQGVYTPDRKTGAKSASFRADHIGGVTSGAVLSFGIVLKGAFAGVAALDPNERDTKRFKSILSGDLNGDDQPGFVNYDDNSHHIFRMDTAKYPHITLDGLVFQGGGGLGRGNRSYGGAMYVLVESPAPVILTLNECNFVDNRGYFGGAIYYHAMGFDLVISGCFFGGNFATEVGGAMHIQRSGFTSISNSVFSRNNSQGRGGAIFNFSDSSNFSVLESTFYENTADRTGGAMRSPRGAINVTNSILFSNGQDPASPLNQVMITFSSIEGGYPGVGNIDADPLFTDPLGPDGILGTPDDNFLPRFGSPVIDAGSNIAVVNPLGFDFAGQPRIVDDRFTPDTGLGAAPIVDMGAYEFQPPACYADLDQSTGVGVLDLFDFLRFQTLFVMNDPFACQVDRSTGPNLCDIFDFLAFQFEFGAGCP